MEVTLMEVTGKGVKFTPETDKKVVQGFVVGKLLPPDLRELYHDGGKKCGKRIYRFYHFSVGDKKLFLQVRDEDAADVLKYLRNKGYTVNVKTKKINETREILYATLSPVFVRRTNWAKRKFYPLPATNIWVDMVKQNLINKIEAFWGVRVSRDDFWIKVKRYAKTAISYDGWSYPGFYVLFAMKGPALVHEAAISYGIGSRNAQGCGMVWPLGVKRKVSSVRNGARRGEERRQYARVEM